MKASELGQGYGELAAGNGHPPKKHFLAAQPRPPALSRPPHPTYLPRPGDMKGKSPCVRVPVSGSAMPMDKMARDLLSFSEVTALFAQPASLGGMRWRAQQRTWKARFSHPSRKW